MHCDQLMRSLKVQIELCLPRLASRLAELDIFERVIQSFYVLVVQNFGFTGQECGLAMETALRLFDFFIFNYDSQMTALCSLVIYCLQICEEYIFAEVIDYPDELFRFIGHGKFLEMCMGHERPDLFEKLVNEFLIPDQRHLIQQEGSFLEKQVSLLDHNNCKNLLSVSAREPFKVRPSFYVPQS